MKKTAHEEFVRFFEEPTRETFRDLVRRNFGELDSLDFKQTWPSCSKLARHILAMANSGGGCIILGVAEADGNSLQAVGLESITDKSEIVKGITAFIPSRVRYEILDFTFDAAEYAAIEGKRFQVVVVEDSPEQLPFVCMADGDGIRRNALYARKGTCSEEAGDYQLQQMLNRRIATGHSTAPAMGLEKHLQELRILHDQLGYPEFVPDDQVSGADITLRQLINDKTLLIRHELGIPEQEVWDLQSHYER